MSTKNEFDDFEFNFETDRMIDPDALDTEWLDQPNIFFKYAARLARANKALSDKEEEIKTIRSEIIKELMDSCEKVTGPVIEATYRTDPDYKQAKTERNQLEFERNMIQVAVDAINYHKKAALENLVKLGLADYFSMPKEPRNLGNEWDRKVKQNSADERVKKASGKKGRRTK